MKDTKLTLKKTVKASKYINTWVLRMGDYVAIDKSTLQLEVARSEKPNNTEVCDRVIS